MVSKNCNHVAYPNHPQLQHRKACSTALMRPLLTSTRNIVLCPRSVFCYRITIDSHQELLLRPFFITKCEIWREHSNVSGVYNNIYDGNI